MCCFDKSMGKKKTHYLKGGIDNARLLKKAGLPRGVIHTLRM
jgi:hypothetical protein